MSATLVDRLGKPPMREPVISDCVTLIDTQVKSKGFMLKSAYVAIKALKKKFVPEVVDSMLDDWLGKIQPHFTKWEASAPTTSFADYLIARSDDVAEQLLQVTDERAEHTSHTTAKKWYLKMRDTAKRNVIEAIPDLARVLERNLAQAPGVHASA
jgi:hypothetical protein